MIRHFAVNECAKVIELCDEILSIIRQRPNTNRAVVTSILLHVIPAEKEGMNIPVVFLPILFGLKTGTLTENGFSQEAFIKYKRRYLDTELNTRSSAFANLLLALCSHVYRSSKTPRIIERELDVLHRNKSAVSRQTTVVEIIPYEHLWEMLITH